MATPLILGGCVTIAPQQKEGDRQLSEGVKEEVETTESKVSKLQVSMEELRETRADDIAIIDTMNDEVKSLRAVVEENEFEVIKIRENLDMISGAIESIDNRLSTQKDTGQGSEDIIERLKFIETSVDTLLERIVSLEQKVSSLNNGTGAKQSTTNAGTEKNDPGTLYMKALNLVRIEKDYKKGLKEFQKFLSIFPEHDLSDNAQYWIGEIYYDKGDWERAALEFNKVREKYPKGDKLPSALLKLGYSFHNLGDKSSAKTLLQMVIKKFPNSTEATSAKDFLNKNK